MQWNSIDALLVLLLSLFGIIQLFYYIFFFARLAFHKRVKPIDANPQIPVSIIICAKNEEANLKKNLSKWFNQQYHKNGFPFYEIIVVNDNSEDDTFYFLQEQKKIYPNLHVVHLTQSAKLIPGKKFALSMGIKASKFEHLLLTDADCTPASSSWLACMAHEFESQKEIVLGYGPYIKYKGWLNKKIRFETLHSAMQYLSFALAKNPYMGVGRNLAYHKNLFISNKGFSSHHHIVSGDDDLFINQVATKRNTSIVIDPNSFMYSEPKQSNEYWRFQKKRHLSTGKYYKTKHKVLLGLYAFSHFSFWVLLIPCLIFHAWWIVTLSIFSLRWFIQWIVFERCCTKLKEEDLINYIWLFDIWLVAYYLQNVSTIFFKKQTTWK
ncbi:MAG: glycosyltransferase [Chitinophagaceae bacterium]